MNGEKYILKTSRLGLRRHLPGDADFMMKLNSDPDVVRYTGDGAFKNLQDAEAVIQKLADQFAFDRTGRFLVVALETGKPIGWCGLRWFPEVQLHDLGYRFLKKEWGKGYATESSLACIAYARDALKITRIFASAMGENHASVRVLEKLGFQPAKIEKTDQTPCELMFDLHL